MAISRISAQDATGTGTTTATATYAAPPTSGNLLIAVASMNDGGPAISNSGWNFGVFSGGATGVSIFYKVAGASEPQAIVLTSDFSASYGLLAIYEYGGFLGTPTLDRTVVSTNGSGLAIASGTTATTTVANELLIAAGLIFATNAISSWSNSFTARNTVGVTGDTQFTADQIVSATGAYSTSATTTGSSAASQGLMATFYDQPLPVRSLYKHVSVGGGMSRSEVAN